VKYVQAALDAFGEPDLDAVRGFLAQVAVTLSTAYPLTEFNGSLGGVVAFVRRAVLATSISDISRSGLNALQSVLREINDNPMIDLDDAAEAINLLERENWHGEHEIASKIVAVLLTDPDSALNESEDDQRRCSDASSY
jgi:hypothetical protein